MNSIGSYAAFDALADTAAKQAGVAARLKAFFRLHAQLLADIAAGRHAPIVHFNDIRALPEVQAAEVFGAYTAMFRRVRGLLKGAETTHLARDDLNARGHIVLSVAHGVRAWIGRCETDEYPRIADRVSDILLHGIAAKGSAWKAADGESAWQLASDGLIHGPTPSAYRNAVPERTGAFC